MTRSGPVLYRRPRFRLTLVTGAPTVKFVCISTRSGGPKVQPDSGTTESGRLDLRLFGCWDLRVDGMVVELGRREQRLLALLALRGRRTRPYVAGTLWPDSTEHRAQTSLRAAVLRTRQAVQGILEAGRTTVGLAPGVNVDVHQLLRAADSDGDPRATMAVMDADELLSGWYDDWVLFERERLQHVRLRALENLAESQLDVGHHDFALEAALGAIAIEPLRESGHAIAIRAHLLAGNRSAAVREYRTYSDRLERELGIAPSPRLDELVRPLLPSQRSSGSVTEQARVARKA
jgi:DNA-binding SARP family transcriptional activator